uniref:Uncharacterized protein n=1 Tax=Romanomermis culicivorax TaxID=13658 RepID=A0A915L7W0_ROMCU
MPNEIIPKILATNPTLPSLCQQMFEPTLTISAASMTGDHAVVHHPKEVHTIPAAPEIIFMK